MTQPWHRRAINLNHASALILQSLRLIYTRLFSWLFNPGPSTPVCRCCSCNICIIFELCAHFQYFSFKSLFCDTFVSVWSKNRNLNNNFDSSSSVYPLPKEVHCRRPSHCPGSGSESKPMHPSLLAICIRWEFKSRNKGDGKFHVHSFPKCVGTRVVIWHCCWSSKSVFNPLRFNCVSVCRSSHIVFDREFLDFIHRKASLWEQQQGPGWHTRLNPFLENSFSFIQ